MEIRQNLSKSHDLEGFSIYWRARMMLRGLLKFHLGTFVIFAPAKLVSVGLNVCYRTRALIKLL